MPDDVKLFDDTLSKYLMDQIRASLKCCEATRVRILNGALQAAEEMQRDFIEITRKEV